MDTSDTSNRCTDNNINSNKVKLKSGRSSGMHAVANIKSSPPKRRNHICLPTDKGRLGFGRKL